MLFLFVGDDITSTTLVETGKLAVALAPGGTVGNANEKAPDDSGMMATLSVVVDA